MTGKPQLTVKTTILSAVLLFAGCYRPVDPPAVVDWQWPDLAVRRAVVGTSVENRPIETLVIGRGPDVTFILAGIHGDEPAGTPLANQLAEYLQQHPQLLHGRRVVILPAANPDGLAHNTRQNLRDVDLNRNFPAENRTEDPNHGPAALSEPEAAVIHLLIRQYDPDRIISIHQVVDTGPEGLAARMPKGCIDYDGPAKELAEGMARFCDLPVEKLGSRPGSLGAYAGLTLNIPIITFEMPLNAQSLARELLWQQYGKALLAAIVAVEAQMQNEAGTSISGTYGIWGFCGSFGPIRRAVWILG
ncbi:MAG: DUF2817 domain-containing protein [Planctomycetota bacterium]